MKSIPGKNNWGSPYVWLAASLLVLVGACEQEAPVEQAEVARPIKMMGIGTVAGGLVHAVAYGLIFDALGRSLVLTLSKPGDFVPEVAAKAFEEGISEHIEAGVRRVAKMALETKAGDD